MLGKAIVLVVVVDSLSGTAASAQTIEQQANQICAAAIAVYHDEGSADPVGGQVLANNLLAAAAIELENIGVPNMLVSALNERAAIGRSYAVSMDQGYIRRTMDLSHRLDENGERIKNVATRLSLNQCARLGGL